MRSTIPVRNIAEERQPKLHRGGSLKSRNFQSGFKVQIQYNSHCQ